MKPEAKLQGHPAVQRVQTGVPGAPRPATPRPAATPAAVAGRQRPPAASPPPPGPGANDRAVHRLREALRGLIDLSGLSRRQIEQRLSALGRGIDLTRLLKGRFEMKVRHVLDLSDVLGIHPLELFRLVFREPQERSPLLQQVQALFAPEHLLPPPPGQAAGQPPPSAHPAPPVHPAPAAQPAPSAHPAPAARPAAAREQDLQKRLEALVEQLERLAAVMGLSGETAPAKHPGHPR
jgi:hypothetical protein